MKSDSLIKATASLLSISLLVSTCFTTVSEASANSKEIISENPVTVSALMMQSINSKTVEMISANSVKGTVEVASTNNKQEVELNKDTTEQSEKAVGNTKEVKNTNTEAKAKTTKTAAKKVSKYAKVGIAIEDVVNIRVKPETTATIVGRLYKGGAANISAVKGDWVYVKSGNVKGYIKKSLLAIGEAAEKIAPKYLTKYVKVNTVTLNVREKASKESKIIIQIGEDEVYKIVKTYPEWYAIKIDSETIGYITKEYVKAFGKFQYAVSMEELQAQAEEDSNEVSTGKTSDSSKSKSTTNNSTKKKSSKKKTSSKKSSKKSSSKKSSSKKYSSGGKSNISSYALQFVGNPYVYGGTSLTNGTDCSGFTQSVYRNCGYSIGRSSRDQYASAGRIVSMNSLKSGDLLFYAGSGGRVNHVAIYIGNGKVVHASNPRDGIKVSSYNYRTPVRARRDKLISSNI